MKCISLFKCNPQIEVIDKSHCSLEDVPNLQSYSRSLEELFLDANKLTVLNENLFRLTNLRRFSFSDNAVQDIPPNIAKLVNLVELDCSRNKIIAIPEQIKFLRGLRFCDFSANNIENLPQGFAHLKNLTILTLNYCPIKSLPEDFGQLKNLESLELRENELESLPQSITDLESLKKLDLGRNYLRKLPDDIGRLKNLEYLLVDGNRLETVPPSIGELENLQCLDLGQQGQDLADFQEFGLRFLPEEIGGLRSLTDLHLSENKLQSLPDGIKNLKSLLIFKADNNYLGELNSNIGGCTSLQELVLTSNRLAELPPTIGYLLDLRSLNVDANFLVELVPKIGYLKKLGILSLRDNCLSHLPQEIGQLDSVRVIDVSGNQLQYLPITITTLNLKALWLSKNQAQPLPRLQIDEIPNGKPVLTCYLLPQQAELDESMHQNSFDNYEPKDGSKDVNHDILVSFDVPAKADDDLENGQFVRHNTPHPKELRMRHPNIFNKNGHDNASFSLMDTKKSDQLDNNYNNRFDSVNLGYESNGLPDVPTRSSIFNNQPSTKSILKNAGSVVDEGRNFSKEAEEEYDDDEYETEKISDRKKEKSYMMHEISWDKTYSKENNYNHKTSELCGIEKEPQFDPINNTCQVLEIVVKRAKNHKPGLGLSIAGGKDTPPFKDGDEGIFVSKVTPNGSSEAAGVRVGDKILAVNHNIFYDGIAHHKAVEIFKKIKPDCSEFTLKLLRDPNFVISDEDDVEDYKAPEESERSRYIPQNNRQKNAPNDASFVRTYSMPIQSQTNGTNLASNIRQSLKSTNENFKSKSSASTLSAGMSLLENNSMNKNIVYTTLVKDYKRDLGLILENKSDESEIRTNWSNIVVAKIKPDSIASADGKLQVNDRILSINGSDVSGVDLNRVKDLLDGTDRFVRIVVSRGDSDDPLGTALRNMPTRPPLGTWFASSANMSQRPSLTGSYRRPVFGSVNSLQSHSLFDPNKQMASSSAAIPGMLPTQGHARSNSAHTRLVGLRSQDMPYTPTTTTTTASSQKENLTTEEIETGSSATTKKPSQLEEYEQRSAQRKERHRSVDQVIEISRIVTEHLSG